MQRASAPVLRRVVGIRVGVGVVRVDVRVVRVGVARLRTRTAARERRGHDLVIGQGLTGLVHP
jgi:hypothetical protein